MDAAVVRQALLIRRVEETLLELFSQGRLNGTVHTCIGQELSAVAFARALVEQDVVVSGHRCHGHFLALTGDLDGLLAEMLGKVTGVCGGIGSSQHLFHQGRFFSNGIQGGMVPVAAGLALARKLRGVPGIGVAFIGDGTLGQGILYETLNLVARWRIPLLIVCEDNRYAQSTPREATLAGTIEARPAAFGIETFVSDTWDWPRLDAQAARSVAHVRATGTPALHVVRTDRLAPHSKGDDTRDAAELDAARARDLLTAHARAHPEQHGQWRAAIDREIRDLLGRIAQEPVLMLEEYHRKPRVSPRLPARRPVLPSSERLVTRLNRCFAELLAEHPEVVLLGEDIVDPYGGAFKVTRGLATAHPDRVLATPISEAAITGLANGLALAGMRPIVEIMFGDFVTLAMDQLINHAAKFHRMYNGQIGCPLILRTPMGGYRGYGPTHSQTLDKFLLGIDTLRVVALNAFTDPAGLYRALLAPGQQDPAIVIENKTLYGARIGDFQEENFIVEETIEPFPLTHIRPLHSAPEVTLVAYGGIASIAAGVLGPLFEQHDLKAELLIPSLLCPLDPRAILEAVERSGSLFVVEEGSAFAAWGAELIATIQERLGRRRPFSAHRIAALPVPIPAPRDLERQVLVEARRIIRDVVAHRP
ncbi:MAG: hypothetical protein HQL82_11225 [Magnetococcales bacterium]|nr:hypothetical protein [Magnetococcales bacterium]